MAWDHHHHRWPFCKEICLFGLSELIKGRIGFVFPCHWWTFSQGSLIIKGLQAQLSKRVSHPTRATTTKLSNGPENLCWDSESIQHNEHHKWMGNIQLLVLSWRYSRTNEFFPLPLASGSLSFVPDWVCSPVFISMTEVNMKMNVGRIQAN